MIDIIEDTGCVMVYTTFGDIKNARTVIDSVMRGGLAACMNMHQGVVSQYIWEGKVKQDNEISVLFKTSEDKKQKLMSEIKRLHQYSMPCLISYKIDSGERNYINWMKNPTAKQVV